MTLQKEISTWATETFGKSTDPSKKILHIFEELCEIFEECENDKQKQETADATIILLHLAEDLNIKINNIPSDFEYHIRKKFEICKNRKWKRHETSLVKHI